MNIRPFAQYGRVSRVGGRNGASYQTRSHQLARIRQHAAARGVLLTGEVYFDEDASGGTMDRTQLNRVRALIAAGELGGLVTARLDRYARTVEEAIAVTREIEQAGGQILCADGDITLASGSDAFVGTVRLALGQLERSKRADDMAASVNGAITRGVHLSAPFGYCKSEGKGTKLEPEPTEAPTVLRMVELRADGYSWGRIAAVINGSGVMPRPHKRHGVTRQAVWAPKTVRQIVLNEAYAGVAYNGALRREDAHEAIVSPTLFARANQAKGVRPIGPSEGYLLSGRVRCGECGYVMVHQVERGRGYYRCRNAQAGRCPGCNVNAAELEALVTAEFEREFVNLAARGTVDDAHARDAELELERSATHLGALLELAGARGASSAAERAVYGAKVSEARTALKTAERGLRKARAAAAGAELPADLDADTFAAFSIPDRRQLLSTAYATIVVRRARRWREPVADRFRLFGRDEAPADSTHLIQFVAELDDDRVVG